MTILKNIIVTNFTNVLLLVKHPLKLSFLKDHFKNIKKTSRINVTPVLENSCLSATLKHTLEKHNGNPMNATLVVSFPTSQRIKYAY